MNNHNNSHSGRTAAFHKLRAATAIWKFTGDPNSILDVASRLLRDDEEWFVVHAKELLGEIGSGQ